MNYSTQKTVTCAKLVSMSYFNDQDVLYTVAYLRKMAPMAKF